MPKKEVKAEPLTLEENKSLADGVLTPIMLVVNIAAGMYEVPRLRATVRKMRSQQSTARALPFPESQAKADRMRGEIDLFEKIVDVVEIRQRQMDLVKEQSKQAEGIDMLRKMGLA